MGDMVVVTGAGSGLGRAVSAQLVADGARVALVDRDLDAARRTASELSTNARAYGADVSDPESVGRAIDEIVGDLGCPSGLVNAAAIQRFEHAHLFDPAEWTRIVAVNLTGTYLMCRAVLPHFIAAGSGAIVNVASTAGLAGIPYDSAYCASKGGVVQLTRSLAIEYSQQGIRVNAVAPGGMQTPMLHVPFPDDSSPELRSRIRRALLEIADPGDVANVVCFLLSTKARYLTGSIIVADGGALA